MTQPNEWNESYSVGEPRGAAASLPSRPVILIDDNLKSMIDKAWRAVHLANRSPTVFLQDRRMVEVVERYRGMQEIPEMQVQRMGRIRFYSHLGQVADWMAATKRGPVNRFPDKRVAQFMYAMPDEQLPVLRTVIGAPVFGADGTLLSEPGYHAADRLWHYIPPGGDTPRIPEQPSPDDVTKARHWLERELLGDFRFAGPSDGPRKCRGWDASALALAAVLLPFARQLVNGPIPAHVVDATESGAGRSLFVDLVRLLATGGLVFGGMGTSQVPEVQEVKRRGGELDNDAVRILLVTTSRRPWLRSDFRHSRLLEWARDHRNQLIHAALVLVKHWLASGRPPGPARLRGFEEWSEVMGGILAAAGIEGSLGRAT